MSQLPFASPDAAAIPLTPVAKADWPTREATLSPAHRAAAQAMRFAGKAGVVLPLVDGNGGLARVLVGLGDGEAARDPFRFGALPAALPPGTYRLDATVADARLAALAFALGHYRFARYKKSDAHNVCLVAPDGVDIADVVRMADASAFARDLINTPANDMGPAELAAAAQELAARTGARFACLEGEALLANNFPLIHAVGMASTRAPRLIDFAWGDETHPKVTLVGKGVCFDTGGLDLKPSSGMLIMKKDMGGAAAVLALARMVMDAKLRVRLRVLIPAVENAVAGNAFRPLDVFTARNGKSVEIGNTDAEGRLVLADALALACEETPDLLIDMGTLTGAARVALGPDLPPFYTNDEPLAADVARHAHAERDPLWRMPLWMPYDSWLDSKTADMTNAPSGAFAGSITCALFLQRFVPRDQRWLHLDIYGWTPSAKPGRPEGGECQGARALYRLLGERYG